VSFTSSPRGGCAGQGGRGFDDADGFGGFQDGRLIAPPMRLEREDLKRWLTEGLSPRDRLIVILYYYEQMTMKEIGQTLGCSESRVSQRLDSIIKCLRSRLTRVGAGALE
jgi:DNA-directed RNA polymerase specialized sigma24 family protein